MKPTIFGILLVLVLIVAGAVFYAKDTFLSKQEGKQPAQNFYANGRYGISFAYPNGYGVEEGLIETEDGNHYVITLTEEKNATPIENGEGSTAITIALYPNEEGVTLEDWLQTEESNFQLGDQTSQSATVSGEEAVSYRWSGLYEGETTFFLHQGNIVAVSVTYLSPDDHIREDYTSLLTSMTLANP